MTGPSSTLTSAGLINLGIDTQRQASAAVVAIGAVGEQATSSKTFVDQLGVNVIIDQVAGCCDLRARCFSRQVAARVGRRGIKLHGLKRELVLVCQSETFCVSKSVQCAASNVHALCTCLGASRTRPKKSDRGISFAPRDAKCLVFCWQSIQVKP